MRRFRFVGNPSETWVKPVKNGEIYPDNYFIGHPLGSLISESLDQDWEEAFDEPKPLHRDTDLGYFAGLAMQGIVSNQEFLKNLNAEPSLVVQGILEIAKELIKQLNEETK